MKPFMGLSLSFLLFLTSCATVPMAKAPAPPVADLCSSTGRGPASLACEKVWELTAAVQPRKDEGKGEGRDFTAAQARQKTLDVEVKDLSSAEVAELWDGFSKERDFTSKNDDVFYGSLIGAERLQAAKDADLHPIAVFGEETAFNWLVATRRLERIPTGQFHLNDTLASEVNRDIYSAYQTQAKFASGSARSKIFQYPSRLEAAMNKYLPKYGGTRRRISLFNLQNVFSAISEHDFQNIKGNEAISGIGFTEMPWSRQGKRYGIFKYPPKDVADAKRTELLEEMNRRMADLREGRSSEDPIDLAAEFQWRFVQIHPFVNGNGRTSRALMNRMLQEFGLPPCARRMIDVDYTLNLQEQKDLVRDGILESLRLAAGSKYEGRITVYRRGHGNRLTAKEIKALTDGLVTEQKVTRLLDLFPQSREQIFEISGQKFTLGDDLVFHDRYGVPYVARNKANVFSLTPISDKTYTLLGWGGKENGIKGLRRDLNESTKKILQDNINFLRAMAQDPTIARQTRVDDYALVERANNADEFQFEEWQIPLLLEITRIEEDPTRNPLAVVVQNRGDKTDNMRLGRDYVEKAFFKGQPAVQAAEIIGHYQIMDQRYYEIQRHVENPTEAFLRNPELREKILGQIKVSREKLHAATRTLLADFIREMATLQGADRDWAMKHPEYRLVYEYFIRTPLAYETPSAAAQRLDPRKTVVLRSAASSRVQITGFMSDRQLKDLVLGVPFFGPRFESLLRDVRIEIKRLEKAPKEPSQAGFIAAQVAKYAQEKTSVKNAVRALLEYVFVNPYANRGLEPEMARAYVTQYLHTQLDKGPKETLSTTVNPAYLLNDKGNGTMDAKFAWQDARIYILEVGRDDIRIDTSSGFTVQQEVGMRPLGPLQSRRAVQFGLSADQNNTYFLPEGPMPKDVERTMQFLHEIPLPAPQTPDQGRSFFGEILRGFARWMTAGAFEA